MVTCARSAEDLSKAKIELELKYAIQATTIQADMSRKEDVKNFCREVLKLNRPVDVLVNNAGYFIPGGITTEPEGALESMINANLYSAYHTTRGLIGNMKQAKSAHIFNMCSIASIKAYPNGGSYAISKFALLGMSKCLRAELKSDNIRVTSVMPGATYTASWEGAGLPEERFMRAEDVAETIYSAFSLSDRSVVEEIIIRPQLGDI